MREQMTSQEYRRQRRDRLDRLVDNGDLLNEMAESRKRWRERRSGFCRGFLRGLVILGSIATPMAILSDKVAEFWNWIWSHGGH